MRGTGRIRQSPNHMQDFQSSGHSRLRCWAVSLTSALAAWQIGGGNVPASHSRGRNELLAKPLRRKSLNEFSRESAHLGSLGIWTCLQFCSNACAISSHDKGSNLNPF